MLWPVRGATIANAVGVNSQGIAVGYSWAEGNHWSATLWKNGKAQVLSQGSVAAAINDKGTIVGFGGGHALLWKDGKVSTLKGDKATAEALSPGGVMGGAMAGAPVVWQSPDAAPIALAVPEGLYGKVMAINDRGQAVGIVHNKKEAWPAYWKNGKFRPIKTLIPAGSTFTELFPRSVNNKGQLIGVGITKSGKLCGFVYTP